MKNTDQIPAEWILYDFSFQLFAISEKKSEPVLEHQVSFVTAELLKKTKRIAELFESGTTPGDFRKMTPPDHVMIIKLSGEFYSVDKILFENLFTGNNEVNLHLKYIRTESFDGNPFEVDYFLAIPVDVSWYKLSIDFQAYKKKFSTGRLEKILEIVIPAFEINLKSNDRSE